jgi:hypothetical protein
MNTVQAENPTVRRALARRLFPKKYLPPSRNPSFNGGLPGWAKDALYCTTTCHLDFLDRLRVLVTGKLVVETRTYTAEVPGAVQTDSVAYPTT